MRTKKKSRLLHWLWLVFSEEYHENYICEQGERIWKELTSDLSEPTGQEEYDKNRLQNFTNRFQKLVTKEQSVLQKWLLRRIASLKDDLENDFKDELNHTILEYEQKWLTIYRQHLAAIR